jgi:hypothetical protein
MNSERQPVHGGFDLYEASGLEVLSRSWHDHVGPAAPVRADLKRGGKALTQCFHGRQRPLAQFDGKLARVQVCAERPHPALKSPLTPQKTRRMSDALHIVCPHCETALYTKPRSPRHPSPIARRAQKFSPTSSAAMRGVPKITESTPMTAPSPRPPTSYCLFSILRT